MVGKKWKSGLVKCKKDLRRSFVSRKAGIMKKARELSVLCGTQVAVVIFGPDKDTPHVWPQSLEDLRSIIGRYLNVSSNERSKAMSMSDFIKEDLEAVEELNDEEGTKFVDERQGKETDLVDEIDGFTVSQLIDLVGNVDAKLAMLNSRIGMIKRAPQNPFEDVYYTLHCDKQMMNNDMQYEEMPLPFNFQYSVDNHDPYFGGSCDSFIGDFPDWGVGVMRKEEEPSGSSRFLGLAPWEKMLM